jgi:2-dehydropantoate 2-reductase
VRRVAVLDANREHVERMRGEGLRIDDFGEERRERLDAYVDPADLGDHSDFALITLKAPYLERAPSHRCSVARWLRPSFLWATALCGSA